MRYLTDADSISIYLLKTNWGSIQGNEAELSECRQKNETILKMIKKFNIIRILFFQVMYAKFNLLHY